MNGLIIVVIIIAVLLLIALAWAGIYNRLVKLRNWVEEAFAQIDVQLQKRNDLIPNLVNTVKGYAKHESETLEAVVKARQQLVNLPSDASAAEINAHSNELSGALSRLLVVAEQYPDLKANTNFTQLQASLEEIEKQIAVARQLFNSSVAQYNTTIQSVPNNIVAGVHHFTKKEMLQAPEEARAVPTVNFD
ncbi:LemA family protein [Eremococcus coleocola]|uniref:LemA family protein n=1 Tax=Eremococcus coleocola ACS-139-V-Col8 TaxID=908337 RepID=E4KQW3_9LACT|nr:LemA family protein [Eremococcus coleocola]EFR30815.1 LemA family protein [Eremococcus coleocola ACS-139-V-Col8]